MGNRLPDGDYGFEVPEKGAFCNEWGLYEFCCGNNNLIMKFSNILGICHLLKDFMIERDNGIVFTVSYTSKKLIKVESNLLLIEDAQTFSDNDGWNKDDAFTSFTFIKYLSGFLAYLWTMGDYW